MRPCLICIRLAVLPKRVRLGVAKRLFIVEEAREAKEPTLLVRVDVNDIVHAGDAVVELASVV